MKPGAGAYAARSAAHGVMFHHFHGARHPAGQGSLGAADFDDLLGYLGVKRLLRAEEWIWKTRRGRLNATDLCLTFDDGLACQYEIALPALESRKLTAFWFICSGPLCGEPAMIEVYRSFRTTCFASVEGFYEAFYLAVPGVSPRRDVAAALAGFDPAPTRAAHPYYSVEDIRFRFVRDEVLSEAEYHGVMAGMLAERKFEVKSVAADLWMDRGAVSKLARDGHEIGLHSHSHSTVLAQLPPLDQRREYSRNFEVLREAADRPPVSVAHPCNSYSPATLEILREMGIEAGFRANMLPGFAGPLEIPREDHANLAREMNAP